MSEGRIYAHQTYKNGRNVAGQAPEPLPTTLLPLLAEALEAWLGDGEAESVTVEFCDTRVKFWKENVSDSTPGAVSDL